VLSPHQDDETIGCGLLMAEKSRSGVAVAAAVATDGRCGWFTPTARPSADEIVTVRHDEWNRALDELTVPRRHRFEFGFPDGALHDHESELIDRITELIERVRPSQIFVTRPGDPHPDHRTLARATCRAVNQVYEGSSPDRLAPVDASAPAGLGPEPQLFSYRVYPGEGIWQEGRPDRVTLGRLSVAFLGSFLRVVRRRPLLLRSPGAAPMKKAAINAYGSQRRLLAGELRYVWRSDVELYWPMDWRAANEASLN
jgi:LmbE family N-acetylglucosaminyl deacetylase